MSKLNKKSTTKTALVIAASVLLAAVVIWGTIAFITDSTADIKNIFKPSAVKVEISETTENGVKSDVKVQNTGDTDAYIRAKVVITWKNENGEVYGQTPVKDTDYTINYNTVASGTGWIEQDGYYYYTDPIAPNDFTDVLINECKLAENVTPPEGYNLSVEILAQGVQAVPKTAVESAWNVTIGSDGKLTPQNP